MFVITNESFFLLRKNSFNEQIVLRRRSLFRNTVLHYLKAAYLRWAPKNVPVFGINQSLINSVLTLKEDFINGELKQLPDSTVRFAKYIKNDNYIQLILASEDLPIDNFNPKSLLDDIINQESSEIWGEAHSFQLLYARDANHKDSKLTDFEVKNLIGKGSISNVYLLRRKSDGQPFAMKCIQKDVVLEEDLYSSTKLEKDLLIRVQLLFINLAIQIKSPFFVNLHYAFISQTKILFIMNFVRGGDLLMHLLNMGTFTEQMTKFMIAQLALALGYLHSNGVLYRDLKLENILINHDGNFAQSNIYQGYVSLVDFGISKKLEKKERTFSIRGTPEYMAPEILSKGGHSFPVDWWALGTLAYEMVIGQAPFYEDDQSLMFRKIMRQNVRFPKDMDLSIEYKDFIYRLLHKDPAQRLGNNGFEEVIQHPFFQDIDFEQLELKTLKAPYIPELTEDPFDVSNFEQELTQRTTFQDGHLSIAKASKLMQRQSAFKNF
ncbi:protein kinase domain containing protein [Stylonychia lemnae]|uniref:Protein kinase domain containing protein n=1 Tax=Stylonychia lemnae TaxID=5949 RepID=A0A077ZWG0_STYLE|nr:protein kinase domain containing protein [Stylonychia lemnae]|eukprot:CDW72781.1 protein kinase domain containing protein [Stylonychia lemnae]